MKNTKDLNWLSAPAFFLILGVLVLSAKKQTGKNRDPEKIRTEAVVITHSK